MNLLEFIIQENEMRKILCLAALLFVPAWQEYNVVLTVWTTHLYEISKRLNQKAFLQKTTLKNIIGLWKPLFMAYENIVKDERQKYGFEDVFRVRFSWLYREFQRFETKRDGGEKTAFFKKNSNNDLKIFVGLDQESHLCMD